MHLEASEESSSKYEAPVLPERDAYQKLVQLSKSKAAPKTLIPKVAEYIDYPSQKVREKVLWMLCEFGLKDSSKIAS